MEFEIKKLPNSKVEIKIEVLAEEFNDFIKRATENSGRDLEVQGFRKGKAPKNIIEEKVGKENILVEAADLAIKENYPKVVLENKIEAIDHPDIDILKLASNNSFIFRARVSILPEIKLPDYKRIVQKIERRKISVEEKEVDNAMKWLQKSRAKLTLKNDSCQKDDFIEIEYSSSQIEKSGGNGVKKDGFILGEGHFIPGFEDKLVGTKAGEEKEFSTTLPENNPLKDLAGKKVDFKVKIKSVQKVELPEINDQFAKGLGNFKDLEALKKSIKNGLNLEKKRAESQRIRDESLEKISQASKFEIPDILIEREQKAMMENLKREVSMKLNIPFDDYLKKIKKTEREVFDSLLEEAQKRVKKFLILREIGKKEKIKVSDEEIRNKANEILKHYPTVEKAEKDIDFDRLKEYSRELLRNEKIFQILEKLTTNKITD